MSGIVGQLSFDRRVRVSPASLQPLLHGVAHRARAAGGLARVTYTGHGIALGACDDCGGGRVPGNESGTIRVVADARLWHADRLRSLLERRGHRIESAAHAELIAHAYEEWGDACVEHLTGSFAFALWDEMARRLLLARDAGGSRPLCFALRHGDGLVFASDMKALLNAPDMERAWSPVAVDAYLAHGFVPAPLTMHPRVSSLEPAQVLVAEGRRLTTRQFWSAAPSGKAAPDAAAADRFETALRRSVAACAQDGDPCLLLSGGPASTAIAAVSSRRETALVVCVDETDAESVRTSAIASHLGLRAVCLRPSLDGAALAPFLAWQHDEPLADPAALVQYAVIAAAGLHARAAMTGHGVRAFMGERTIRAGAQLFDATLRGALYTRRFSDALDSVSPERGERRTCASDTALTTAERAAFSAGLELSHPLLDRDVVDAAAALRETVAPGALLRRVAERHLPPALASHLPSSPAPGWLTSAIAQLAPAVLLQDRFHARGILSPPAVRSIWEEHSSGRRSHALRLWALVMLELWLREFMDDDAAAHPVESLVRVRAA